MNNNKAARTFLSPPHMGGDEIDFVTQAFDSNYIAPLGPMVDAFEHEFAEYTGIPHCLALSSGTAATHLALRHLLTSDLRPPTSDLRPLVIASTLTFIGSVTPATFERCELRFIDCDRDTWNMDTALLEQELAGCAREGRQVLAVIPTDLYGQCCNLPRIVEICQRFAVPVICDSAEAMGARYAVSGLRVKDALPMQTPHPDLRHQVSGFRFQECKHLPNNALRPDTQPVRHSLGEGGNLTPETSSGHHSGFDAWASIYSFNGNKIITTSGGGMLASHDKAMIDHARKLATQARDPAPHYEHSEIGFNYRMSNIVAAIGRGQLQVLDQRVEQKRLLFEQYRERLSDLPGITFMPEAPYGRANRWLTVILIDPREFGADTHAIREALERENIEARPVWKPMHLQPVFKGCRIRGGAVSEEFFAKGLCLPSGTAMTEADVDRVVKVVRSEGVRH